VKLGELGSWLARRNKTPPAMVAAVSRGMSLFSQKKIAANLFVDSLVEMAA
jgi:hypothetical protein